MESCSRRGFDVASLRYFVLGLSEAGGEASAPVDDILSDAGPLTKLCPPKAGKGS